VKFNSIEFLVFFPLVAVAFFLIMLAGIQNILSYFSRFSVIGAILATGSILWFSDQRYSRGLIRDIAIVFPQIVSVFKVQTMRSTKHIDSKQHYS
jgi:hypothetical protein